MMVGFPKRALKGREELSTGGNYWLIVLPRNNYNIALREETVGFSLKKSHLAGKIKPGDKIVFYLTRESVDPKSKKIGLLSGVVEVVSKVFYSESLIWPSVRGDNFPYRVKISPIDISSTAELKPLSQDLSFVYSNLGTPLQKGYVQLKTPDWEIILKAMNISFSDD